MARLVITRSTYVEGLIPLLRRLATLPEIAWVTTGGDHPGAGPLQPPICG